VPHVALQQKPERTLPAIEEERERKIRNPNIEAQNKFELPKHQCSKRFRFRILNFGIVSSFGFRASDLVPVENPPLEGYAGLGDCFVVLRHKRAITGDRPYRTPRKDRGFGRGDS